MDLGQIRNYKRRLGNWNIAEMIHIKEKKKEWKTHEYKGYVRDAEWSNIQVTGVTVGEEKENALFSLF